MASDSDRRAASRRRGGAIGKRGEDLAADWLARNGYTLLARNWRCPYGELDLIAELGDEVIGVEVKTRTGDAMGAPEEAVTPAKQRKLLLTLQSYLMERGAEQRPYRLDVIAVRLATDGGRADIRHYPAAFAPGNDM